MRKMSTLDEGTKTQLIQAFENKRNRDVLKILKPLLKTPTTELMTSLTEAFAEMLAMDPTFFMETIYLDIQSGVTGVRGNFKFLSGS